jgi:ABC-type multidrug transport system ATPase subunit
MTFKNQQVLKDCTWEVKKGERAGLVGGRSCVQQHSMRAHAQAELSCGLCAAGVNGAGKTTQLQIVMGKLSPDTGVLAG